MSHSDYAKCDCQKCGQHIEFPKVASGEVIQCPHCQQETVIDVGFKSRRLYIFLVLGAVFLAICFGTWKFISGQKQTVDVSRESKAVTNTAKAAPSDVPKSLDNLKSGKIILEKKPGSDLVYAVGTLTNDSRHQHFGVTVEIDLFDQKGAKIGTATDYIALLEPDEQGKIRALVVDGAVVTARMAAIREAE